MQTKVMSAPLSATFRDWKAVVEQREFRRLPQLSVFVVCVLGFSWQFTHTVQTYLRYDTISQCQMSDPKRYNLPAMTMCQRPFVSRVQLAKLFPEAACLASNVSKNVVCPYDRLDEIEKLIRRAINEHPIKDLFGHDYQFEENGSDHRCELNLLTSQFYDKNGSVNRLITQLPPGQLRPTCNMASKPLESLMIYGMTPMYKKCFTYFSLLNKNADRLNLTAEEFQKFFQVSEYRVPKYRGHETSNMVAEFFVYKLYDGSPLNSATYQDVRFEMRRYFTIHAPDSVHSQEEFQDFEMDPNHWYKIFFRRIEARLLKAPFETNCVDYRLGDPDAIQSRDDCYTQCLLEHYRKECGCIPEVESNYRMAQLKTNDRFCRFNVECNKREADIEHCDNVCHPSCSDVYYRSSAHTYKANSGTGRLTIVRREEPEVTYIHLPAMPWIQFLCNVGSIFGMWLGISFLHFFRHLVSILDAIKNCRRCRHKRNESSGRRKSFERQRADHFNSRYRKHSEYSLNDSHSRFNLNYPTIRVESPNSYRTRYSNRYGMQN